MFQCCICDKGLNGMVMSPKTKIPNYFCGKCFKEWESAIKSNAEWIVFLRNEEQKRRRNAPKEDQLVYLGGEYDLSEDGELIQIREEA